MIAVPDSSSNRFGRTPEDRDSELIPKPKPPPWYLPYLDERVPPYIERDRETDRFSKSKKKMKIRCDGCGKTISYHTKTLPLLGNFVYHRLAVFGSSIPGALPERVTGIDMRHWWELKRFPATYLCLDCFAKRREERGEPKLSDWNLKRLEGMFDEDKIQRMEMLKRKQLKS